MSETRKHRHLLARYCRGLGMDIGFGGDPIVQDAITVDLPQPYTRVGSAPQVLAMDARHLQGVCSACMDYVYSSHLLEDFSWHEIQVAITEWRRVLKPGGVLVLCCPDERVYREHCARRGEAPNEHHKIGDFSLSLFKAFLLTQWPVGAWINVYSQDCTPNDYSWHLVVRKVGI